MNDAPPSLAPAEAAAPEALLRRVAGGDRAAFRALYDSASPRLYGLALRLTRSRPLAEEVMQEVFLSVWRHAATYDPARGPAMPWLARILRNRVADRMRRREPPSVPIEEVLERPAEEAWPEQLAELGQEARRVAAAMAELPPRVRAAVELIHFGQASYAEAAERLGVPVNTVKSWVRRALLRLRARLEAEDAVRR